MADVDELFDLFDEEPEDKQQAVPIVLEDDKNQEVDAKIQDFEKSHKTQDKICAFL